MRRFWIWFGWVACLLSPSLTFAQAPSIPQPPDIHNRVDELEWQVMQLQQQLTAQQHQQQQLQLQQQQLQPPIPPVPSNVAFPIANTYDSAPCPCEKCGKTSGCGCQGGAAAAAGAKKFPTVELHGFFQADAGWINQSAANVATVGDVQDGADFRRARLLASGDAWNNVGYMVEMDFAFPGRPSFMDVWMEVRDVPLFGTIRGGQYRNFFSMDCLTSVKELTFLERALPFAFSPFRQISLGFYNHAENELATWGLSVFRYPTDFFGGNTGDNGGYGTAGRVTFLPYIDEASNTLLHLGGNFSFADPSDDLSRFRNQPEFFVGETAGSVDPLIPDNFPPFVDTGLIPTTSFNVIGAELAGATGSFYWQSEFMHTSVNRPGDAGTYNFSGGYAYAAYLLTGERRPYNRTQGVFGRIVPDNPFDGSGIGAWELAGRWSYIDVTDGDVQGGRLTDLTFGLNWYLNEFAKLQFNYIHAFLNRPPGGQSEAGICAVRGQVFF